MPKIGIFYGSTDGNTLSVAERIKEKLDPALARQGGEAVELLDVADCYLGDMVEFDLLILGVPTWNVGQLQRDWDAVLPEFDEIDLRGKKVALFGLGDQVGYPDTFADALFFVAERARSAGAELVGAWPVAGYSFRNSWAVEDGRFLGLILDEHNQPELTEMRLDRWLATLSDAPGLAQMANDGNAPA